MLRPVDIPGVRRFAQVTPFLWRGAQPTRRGFEELKRRGVRTIVNLRSFHSDRDEMAGLGLRYVHIYAKAWHPEDEDLLAFLQVVRDPRNHPVFVHCQHGVDRTGVAIAVYRIVQERAPLEAAIAELRRFGFHPVWWMIESYLEAFRRRAARRALRDFPHPRVRRIP